MIRHGALKPHGHIIVSDVDGRESIRDTLQCCHCGQHFEIRCNGMRKGWCANCSGPTCGRQRCEPCVPYMQRVDEPHRVAPERRTAAGIILP